MSNLTTDYRFFPINGVFGPSKDKGVYVYKDGTIKFHKCCGNANYKLSTCEFQLKDLRYIRHYASYKFRFYIVAYSFSLINSIIFEDESHKILASMPVGIMKKKTTEELVKYLKSLKSDIGFDEAVEQLYTDGSWSLMYKRLFKAFMRSMWPWFVAIIAIFLIASLGRG